LTNTFSEITLTKNLYIPENKMLYKNSNFIRIFALFFIVIFFSCADKNNSELSAAKKDADSQIKNIPLNESAMILAGKSIDKNSKLYKFSSSAISQAYSKEINAAWKKFQEPNLKKISEWWKNHAPKKTYSKILYPFSGPDIMNALVFFPDADTYTMFGLEHPGVIPDMYNMTDAEIINGLKGLKNSLGTILHVNFFKTEGMAVELGAKSFNSITGLIMFFLSMNDYEIAGARKIIVNKDSLVEDALPADDKINWQNPPKSRVPGVEILFRKNGGKIQTVRYFMLNVIDNALATHSPNFIPFIDKNGQYAAVIKSASYLMHNQNDKFTKIRASVLNSCDYIVQDDSGVPLLFLSPDKWKVACHGYYDRPIALFANRAQKDLKEMFKKSSTGILPFSYGYDYRINESNLLTAEKIK
jgi:hypothetical protein